MTDYIYLFLFHPWTRLPVVAKTLFTFMYVYVHIQLQTQDHDTCSDVYIETRGSTQCNLHYYNGHTNAMLAKGTFGM